jgi:beta-N-acetylhexosaminidase/D-alanyl-D-alanine dipeptidase
MHTTMKTFFSLRTFALAVASLLLLLGCETTRPDSRSTALPPASEFVDIAKFAPSIRLDIRYATTNNFTHQAVYPSSRCLLRRAVAERLARVQADLQRRGLSLKIWDAYRPISVQVRFWKLMPDERYVLEPVFKDGKPVDGSKHNRGAAVDVTLVDAAGRELEMPSHFDDFSERAWRDYKGSSPLARRNMGILEDAMRKQGFLSFPTEWWHFNDPYWETYELSDVPLN